LTYTYEVVEVVPNVSAIAVRLRASESSSPPLLAVAMRRENRKDLRRLNELLESSAR
jgi:hypothetical protein